MKSFFKRTAVSVIVLGMAGSVYAAMPSKNSSWCPQVSGAFIGVEGLDLRPQNGDLDYVTVFPDSLATTGSFNNDAISTSYHWGWRVYAGLKITENDDLTASWMSLNTSMNDSVAPTGTNLNGTSNSTPRWLFENDWVSATGHVNFKLDDAYAVYGHTIYFNNPWSVRFAGGVEWARVQSNMTVTADSGIPAGLGVVGFESKSNTRGVGPRAEFDMTYHLPYGFAVFGNANAAMLVSTRDISLDPTNNTQDVDIFFTSDFSDRHVVIPKFGARLGLSYSYTWGQAGGEGCTATTLMVDAGWQAETFIHAIERPTNSFDNTQALLQSRSTTSFADTKVSNFSDSGLFLGVQLGMDWI